MDYGHEQTDKELKKLERKLAREYKAAKADVERKIKAHFQRFDALDKEYAAKVAAGEMSKKDYIAWRKSAMMTGKRWEDLRDTLAADLSHTNEIATGMINGHAIDCYALNMNYGTYEVENGIHANTAFTIYDHTTVENLMKKDPHIIPKARMDIPKDKRWNRQKLTSAITQGILTGESIPKIAKRLAGVADMNAHAALRNARTYTTAAENKGRVDSYERAKDMGIEMEQEWMSTPDGRTRDSHVDLDGEKVPVGGTFSNGCKYPGDPGGAPEEVYNCRCTLVAALKDYKYDPTRFTRLPEGMTYEDWKGAHESPSPDLPVSYYKPIIKNDFISEYFSADDVDRINKRFEELDAVYHAKIDDIVSVLQVEQEQYDLFRENYIKRLKQENPGMRQSTIEKRATELLGARPTRETIDGFEGGNFNMESRIMAINNFSAATSGGITEDIAKYQKRLERWEKRHGTSEGYVRGNVGTTHEATFIHEYGHAIDATYGVSKDERFLNFYRGFTRDGIASGVSEYAATNEQEFIAECFLDSFMGDAQGETSKQFMEILSEIIGG